LPRTSLRQIAWPLLNEPDDARSYLEERFRQSMEIAAVAAAVRESCRWTAKPFDQNQRGSRFVGKIKMRQLCPPPTRSLLDDVIFKVYFLANGSGLLAGAVHDPLGTQKCQLAHSDRDRSELARPQVPCGNAEFRTWQYYVINLTITAAAATATPWAGSLQTVTPV
jgi:hypothetical protein